MKLMCVMAGALCILAVCAAALPTEAGAAGKGLAAIGDEGFSAPSIGGGFAAESAPMVLAKKKKKKKKKGGDEGMGSGASVRIDPNTASVSELKVLPFVDEATAQAIIARRPYKAAEDLAAVPEIGPCKYRIFKHLIEVRQPEDAGGDAGNAAEEMAP
jgi:hypothetical protein